MNQLDLNGNWELRDADGALLCPVKVPGSVLSGLYAAGKTAHPYYRENEYAAFLSTSDAADEEVRIDFERWDNTFKNIYRYILQQASL